MFGRIFGFFMRVLLAAMIIYFGLRIAAHYGIIDQSALQEVSESVSETVGEHVDLPGLPSAKPVINWDTSKEGYYYAFLNEDEQQVYQTILQACESFEFKVELPKAVSTDTLFHAVCAVTCDYPEYYWVNTSYTYFKNAYDNVLSVEFASNGDEAQKLAEIERMADEVLADLPATDYAAYKYLYDWVIETTDYDASAAESGQHLTSVFFDHRSVCAGYSKAFQYLCHKAGLKCTYVTGTAVMRDGSQGSHAWNLIRVNGTYCWADVTWGDPLFEGYETTATNYNYFAVSDRFLRKEHTIDTMIASEENQTPLQVEYPVCDSNDWDWYVQNGSFFETYDAQAVKNYILWAQYAVLPRVDLKFGSSEELMNAVADLLTNERFFYILQESGIPCTQLSYVLFEPIGAVWILPG